MGLGSTWRSMGDYRAAVRALREALAIHRDLGDRLGQADALRNLGILRRLTGDYQAAAEDLERALGIFRDLGARHGQAGTLHDLGVCAA
jgi:tetratricopeptide (TPR) repeat protein